MMFAVDFTNYLLTKCPIFGFTPYKSYIVSPFLYFSIYVQVIIQISLTDSMQRFSLFSFDIMSHRGTKQIEIPLLRQHQREKYDKNLYQNQVSRIVDLSHHPKRSQSTLYERLCAFIQRTLSVIYPSSDLFLLWNILNLLAIFYNFIQIPVILTVASAPLARTDQNLQYIFTVVDNICLLTFILDLLFVRYRIAYYSNEILVTDVRIILTKYIKSGLSVDLVAFMVYFFDYLFKGYAQYVKIIFYIKFYTLMKIDTLIQSKAMYNQYANAFYRFIKMVGLIFFLTSVQACIYFAIDYSFYEEQGFNYQNGYMWLTASESSGYLNLLQAYNWPGWFVYALYWAVQTTSSVGYGNNTPHNPAQVLLCNIVMLTTIFIFVSFANRILDIVDELQENDLQRQAKFTEINTFTRVNQAETKTTQKIKFYFNCLISSKEDSDQFVTQLLPTKLQEKFNLNFKYFIFDNLHILSILTKDQHYEWNSFAYSLTHLIKMKYYTTDDYIQYAGKNSNFHLSIIERGKVTAFNDIIGYKKDYRVWEYFGQKEFFFQGISLSNVICRTFVKVYYFQRQQFFNLLKEHRDLYDRCCEKIDEVRYHNRMAQDFEITCHNCDEYHLLECCPIATLWRDKLPKVKKIKQSTPNERMPYERKNQTSTLKIRHYTKELIQIDQIYTSKTYFAFRNV